MAKSVRRWTDFFNAEIPESFNHVSAKTILREKLTWHSGQPTLSLLVQGPVSRKSRKLFKPEKPFVKLWPAYSVKLVFSYVVKGIKIKITARFRAARRLSFEDTKRIMSPKMHPKSFGTFEKQALGPLLSDSWDIKLTFTLSYGYDLCDLIKKCIVDPNAGIK